MEYGVRTVTGNTRTPKAGLADLTNGAYPKFLLFSEKKNLSSACRNFEEQNKVWRLPQLLLIITLLLILINTYYNQCTA
jgi:hypothetical protein